MTQGGIRFYFDYVDPASYLVHTGLGRLAGEGAVRVEPRPFEIRTPPRPLLNLESEAWRTYWLEMTRAAERAGIEMRAPALVPWSRKAHELALHAAEKGCFDRVHEALFRAHFVEGRDVGRIDVLVALGVAAGLERTETKAVLDVDRHLDALLALRQEALDLGVRGVPTLLAADGRTLAGFAAGSALESFVTGPRGQGPDGGRA